MNPPTLCLAPLALGALLSASATAQIVTIDPTECVITADPGQVAEITLEVCVPGQSVDKADIYLLADTTTSMQPVLDQIRLDAVGLVQTLLANSDVDVQIGVGRYRDFPFDDPPFAHLQSISDDEQTIAAAIDTWQAGGGGDGSEGQFYALHRLAIDPNIGFRPDAKRIVVMFGDSPAHDPICDSFMAFVGEPGVTVTEASVTAELLAAGPFGGTTVVAIGVPTGYIDALNDDPLASAEDYTVLNCAQDGTPGQADRLSGATAGISTNITDPAQITQEIIDTIEAILSQVEVVVQAAGEISTYVSDIDPPLQEVELPQDPTQTVCVSFTISIDGGTNCVENQSTFEGQLEVLVNGQVAAAKPVTVLQPACDTTVCLLYLGIDPLLAGLPGGEPDDLLYIDPQWAYPVLLDDVPAFHVPDDPAFLGLPLYFQVVMSNAADFPDDPVKTSNGLEIVLGRSVKPIGEGSGMQLWLPDGDPSLGQSLQVAFSIDGF